MKESDFPQFPDPRVREVMAAAANLVEYVAEYVELFAKHGKVPITIRLMKEESDKVTAALFAAQHSKQKEPPCVRVHGKEAWCEKCEVGACAHCGDPMAGCRGRCQDDS